MGSLLSINEILVRYGRREVWRLQCFGPSITWQTIQLDQLSREVSLKREGVALLGRVERGYRPETLREASLIALELWRRYQESPWEQVFSNAQFELDPERWNTPLVCLWAYLEDARPLLEFLAILPEPLCYPLTLHVLLSQPLTDQEQWIICCPWSAVSL